MLEWLASQPGVTAYFESRALVVADSALTQIERFEVTSRRLDRHVTSVRALVSDLLGERLLIPRPVVVHKEPLEPIAFPDGAHERFVSHCRLVLPGLRILFMIRDPVSTIWSMRQRKWGVSLTVGEPEEWTLSTCIEVWKANARLAKQLANDEAVRVCRLETLLTDTESESREIALHAGVRMTRPFEPRPTKEIGFTPADRDRITSETLREREWFGY